MRTSARADYRRPEARGSAHRLHPLFHPRSVAIVGASADPGRLTARPLAILERHRYEGRIHLVNPSRSAIATRPCYPSVDALPEPVDVALVCTPASTVPEVIGACGRRGIRNAIVIASGFEDAEDGTSLAADLRAAASAHGVSVVGPNSEGLWSVPQRALLTFGSAALRESLVDGPVTVISQSGGVGAALVRELSDRGVGCRYFVSVGNETVLTIADYLDYVLAEGGTRTVVLHLEAVSDARTVGLVRAARERGVRVVVLRAGASEEGRLATVTHTGRMASGARAYGDVLRACGAVEAASLDELVAASEAVTVAPPAEPGPRGGVSVVSVSGGCRALIVDALAARGLPLARFAPETERALEKVLPAFGHARNPVDVTGALLSNPVLLGEVLERVAADAASGAILVQLAGGGARQLADHEEQLVRFARRVARPVVIGLLAEEAPVDVRVRLQRAGIVIARDPTAAVNALAWVAGPEVLDGTAEPEPTPGGTVDPAADGAEEAVLRLIGASQPAQVLVAPGDDLLTASRQLREPLVAKAQDGHVAHRTEQGLVRVGIRGQVAVEEAVSTLRRLLGDAPVVLQEQVTGVEVLLSASRHPDLGPVLAIGSGGVRTELLDDIAFVPLPASRAEVAAALRRTRVWQHLVPWRGRPGADVDALVSCGARLGRVLLASPGLSSVELNPLLVDEDGCTAVDVLLVPEEQA